jgi:hypothetical protein
MDSERVRAWWWKRQGLDGGCPSADPSDILAQAGWARSIGGSAPYLTLWARGSCSRETADRAVADLSIHELPCARGCTYVVPRQDFELALLAAEQFADADMKVARKLGVTDGEVERLCTHVLDALSSGPLAPEAIREAAGDSVRSLGPEGVKKGIATTLPLALGKLQVQGAIRRVPVNGRIDGQRYRYARWDLKLAPREGCYTELARRYFRWIGPATLAEFQWFSGLGIKAAKEAVAPLQLAPYGMRLLFPDDLDAMLSMRVPDEADYKLVSSIDALNQLRRDVRDLLAGEDMTRVDDLRDLPNHGIFDRGRLVGLWEYDAEERCIVWVSFIRSNNQLRAAVNRAEEFVREQLGDVRAMSLDSPNRRRARIEALRARA